MFEITVDVTSASFFILETVKLNEHCILGNSIPHVKYCTFGHAVNRNTNIKWNKIKSIIIKNINFYFS